MESNSVIILGKIDLSVFEKYTPEYKAKQVELRNIVKKISELQSLREQEELSLHFAMQGVWDYDVVDYHQWQVDCIDSEIAELQVIQANLIF